MIVDSNHRDSYLEMQDYVSLLLDNGVSEKVTILCTIGSDPKTDMEITKLFDGFSGNEFESTKFLHGMRKRLHTILNTPFDREYKDVLSLDYRALAQEAYDLPGEFDNHARVEWLNRKLGLNIRLVGELSCPTLMAPIDDWVSRERFRLFLGEFLAFVKEKNTDKYKDVPGYFERLNVYRANIIDEKLETHTTLEKFDGFFSTIFFRIGIDARQFYSLVQEYKKIPTETSDKSRERALWILKKTGQNLFYGSDGNVLDPLMNGVPDKNSVPYWDRQTGMRTAMNGFTCSSWGHFSALGSGDSVVAGGFYSEGAGCGFGFSNIARVPFLRE